MSLPLPTVLARHLQAPSADGADVLTPPQVHASEIRCHPPRHSL